ncbi:MAG: hypothetical protein MJ136_00680 [Clostridia bacterium]|nr:hypothetical protein [Clostridia bacterium]
MKIPQHRMERNRKTRKEAMKNEEEKGYEEIIACIVGTDACADVVRDGGKSTRKHSGGVDSSLDE